MTAAPPVTRPAAPQRKSPPAAPPAETGGGRRREEGGLHALAKVTKVPTTFACRGVHVRRRLHDADDLHGHHHRDPPFRASTCGGKRHQTSARSWQRAGATVAECTKGTLAVAAKCEIGGQCTTVAICSGFTGTACGACAAAKALGDTCGAPDYSCGGGDSPLRYPDVEVRRGTCGRCRLLRRERGQPVQRAGLVCYSDTKCAVPRATSAERARPSTTTTTSLDWRRTGLQSCGGTRKCADVAPTVHAIGVHPAQWATTARAARPALPPVRTAYANSGDTCARSTARRQPCNPARWPHLHSRASARLRPPPPAATDLTGASL